MFNSPFLESLKLSIAELNFKEKFHFGINSVRMGSAREII